ncbi:MAG: motility associated factor glycosyltransferase family protein [Myxococcales bacterium FL481]|nr:MAG: motility associated factor glycosyltransferase family protein [Myxococcales bacterium FL481]
MADLPEPIRLQQLFARDRDGLDALLQQQVSERVSTTDTPHGPVISVDGRKLHSTRDPCREARRFVRNVDLGESTMVILLGLGSGHVARAIAHQTSARLVVFEPDLEALAVGLGHGPLPPNTQILTTPRRLGSALYAQLTSSDRGLILVWRPCARQAPLAYRNAAREARLAIERARFRDITTQVRIEGWLDFYLDNLPQLLRGPGLDKLRGKLTGVPAFICAAGPSLDKNIAQLRQVQDNALILAVNTAASALAAAGVQPHAIVSVESLDITQQLAGLPWLSEIAAFLELTGNPAMFDLPVRRVLPISVDTSTCSRFTAALAGGQDFSGGFCVANTATALAQAMGCRPLVLVGQDLAYAGDRVYAEGTMFEDVRIDVADGVGELRNFESKRAIERGSQGSLKAGVRQATSFRTDVVPGWGGGPDVVSPADFQLFRDWYAHSAETLRDHGIRPINATEGGASIDGWDEVPLAEVIDTYRLAEPRPDEPSVGQRFKAMTSVDGLDRDALVAAVQAEREVIATMLRLGLEARALVDHDPDGDLNAPLEVSTRLATINQDVSALLRRGPLCTEALTVPLDLLRDRQELNTVSMHQVIEQHLERLDERLEAVLNRLDGSTSRPSLDKSA